MIVQVTDEKVIELTPEYLGGVENFDYLIGQLGFDNHEYDDYGLQTLFYVGF